MVVYDRKKAKKILELAIAQAKKNGGFEISSNPYNEHIKRYESTGSMYWISITKFTHGYSIHVFNMKSETGISYESWEF